jgi:hypothetical protein
MKLYCTSMKHRKWNEDYGEIGYVSTSATYLNIFQRYAVCTPVREDSYLLKCSGYLQSLHTGITTRPVPLRSLLLISFPWKVYCHSYGQQISCFYETWRSITAFRTARVSRSQFSLDFIFISFFANVVSSHLRLGLTYYVLHWSFLRILWINFSFTPCVIPDLIILTIVTL